MEGCLEEKSTSISCSLVRWMRYELIIEGILCSLFLDFSYGGCGVITCFRYLRIIIITISSIIVSYNKFNNNPRPIFDISSSFYY